MINELKKRYNIKKFVLWGRSMGAVCAFKYIQMLAENRKNHRINKQMNMKAMDFIIEK